MNALQQAHADLEAVRELLSDPNRWTKGAMARNARLWPVDTGNSTAQCFCLIGAMARITRRGIDNDRRYHNLRSLLTYQNSLTYLNDSSSHEGLLAFLDNELWVLRQKMTPTPLETAAH